MGTGALSEKSMLAVKRLKLSKEDNAPSLDDFDREMEVYRVCNQLSCQSFLLFHLSDSVFLASVQKVIFNL